VPSEALGLPRGYASALTVNMRVGLARLAGELAGALGAGDLDTAREIAKRIAFALDGTPEVVDLAAERARRARKTG